MTDHNSFPQIPNPGAEARLRVMPPAERRILREGEWDFIDVSRPIDVDPTGASILGRVELPSADFDGSAPEKIITIAHEPTRGFMLVPYGTEIAEALKPDDQVVTRGKLPLAIGSTIGDAVILGRSGAETIKATEVTGELLGRKSLSMFGLDQVLGDPHISRRHVQFLISANGLQVKDLSPNHIAIEHA